MLYKLGIRIKVNITAATVVSVSHTGTWAGGPAAIANGGGGSQIWNLGGNVISKLGYEVTPIISYTGALAWWGNRITNLQTGVPYRIAMKNIA